MSDVQIMASVIQVKSECIEEYCRLHQNTWPAVVKQNGDSNLKNYSIFIREFPDGKHYLFSYAEYVGDDFKKDMQLMAENEEVQKWWELCKPMHIPFSNRDEGEWWAQMTKVCHRGQYFTTYE